VDLEGAGAGNVMQTDSFSGSRTADV
jgi:hypothetical protein